MAKRLEKDIWKLLDRDFPAADVPDAFERDIMRHDAYASPRKRLYLGGETYLDQLKTWLDDDAPKIRIEGQSGGGKSALLANFINAYRKDHPKDLVFEHFLGASADAANPYALIHRLIEFIQRTTNSSLDIPEDPNALIESLPSWLATASAWAKKKKRHWIFAIDSINSLTDLTDLRWWPEFVPAHIHFIISCLPGTVMNAFKNNRETTPWQVLTVKPLNKRQTRDLLITYLAHYNKVLPKPMMDQILTHPLVRNPLFLRTLGEELRVFGVHEELQQQINHYLESQTIDDEMVKIYPGVVETLQQLKDDGHKIAIVTSKDVERTKVMIKDLPEFDCVVSPKSGLRGKPAPDQLLFAMAMCNVDPQDSYYVGDMQTDYWAAERAGVKFIHVNYGYGKVKCEVSLNQIEQIILP